MTDQDSCQWCGMDRAKGLLWKCGTKQNSKGSMIQSEACAEIARLKAIVAVAAVGGGDNPMRK